MIFILYYFLIYCGLTPFDEFYILINLLIDPDHGLYESSGIHEMFTLDLKYISSCSRLFENLKINIFVYKKDMGPS